MKKLLTSRGNGPRNQFKSNDLTEESKIMSDLKRATGFPGPHKTILSQAPFVAKGKCSTTIIGTWTGSASGTLAFNNHKFILSLYQPMPGVTPTFAGRTQLSSNYGSYICMRAKYKLRILNENVIPVYITVTNGISLPNDGQPSFQTHGLMPYSQRALLGSASGGRSYHCFSGTVDASSLFGYDISSVNSSNFLTSFGANPSYESGAIVIFESADLTTVPLLSFVFECEFESVLQMSVRKF
jgi:hypothetical protein